MSFGALVDYDVSSSSEEDSDSENESSEEETTPSNNTKSEDVGQRLPSAVELLTSSSQKGVFCNPFKQAEDAKIASLEKHVKMVENNDKIQTKNGKKICINFRKGRCRFGSNCKYAHDSDLHYDKPLKAVPEPQTSLEAVMSSQAPPKDKTEKRKKRPGLGDSIVPNKKVLKQYSTQKTRTNG